MGNTILIAENNPRLRRIMANALDREDRGYEIDEVDDCPAGLAALRDRPRDVLIADLQVPAARGLDVLRTIHGEFTSLPVLVTGLGDERHVMDCFGAGAWDYFVKPFKLPHLAGMLRRVLIAKSLFTARPGEFEVVAHDDKTLAMVVGSEIEYVRRFRRLAELLLRDRLPRSVRTEVRTAIEEIGRNAVEWGNKRAPDRRVRLSYELDTDRITIHVEDEGEGFAHDALCDPSVDPVGTVQNRYRAGRRPGGFGIFVTRLAMDEVRYNERGNAVDMVKKLR